MAKIVRQDYIVNRLYKQLYIRTKNYVTFMTLVAPLLCSCTAALGFRVIRIFFVVTIHHMQLESKRQLIMRDITRACAICYLNRVASDRKLMSKHYSGKITV